MSSPKDFVENTINNNKVVIFSKSYCPYCAETKQLFKSKFSGVKVEVIESDMDAIQDYIKEKTGKRSVPQTFIGRQHVGGNDDLQAAYKAGKVKTLLEVSQRKGHSPHHVSHDGGMMCTAGALIIM
ncbi:thioredoxin-like protein [Pisolithus tinctorius]|nr:thioredoxin-like protein [Pisolithus tinctorius]